MGDRSAIEWTDATWNPLAGCSRVSEGCRHCYAERMAARGLPGFVGLARFVDHPDGSREARWTGAVTVREHLMDQPLRWRSPRRIFVNSMSDLFHDAVPDEVIDRIFAVMALASQHTFQILTKRPERMRRHLSRAFTPHLVALQAFDVANKAAHDGIFKARMKLIAAGIIPAAKTDLAPIPMPLPNVWLGVSVEDQVTADTRIPYLLETPAAVRWISAEPLLGPIDVAWALSRNPIEIAAGFLARGRFSPGMETLRGLDLVVPGGESGPHARPMHPDWVRSLRDQCAVAGVPFFFKQWGEWAPSSEEEARGNPYSGWRCLAGHPHVARADELYPEAGAAFMERKGKRAAGRLLDGVEHNGMPEARDA